MDSDKKKIVYCSGPLFCPEEIGGMTAISSVLEDAGYDTFLPHRDGVEAHVMGLINSPLNINFLNIRKFIDKAIFCLDIYQLVERTDYIVFNMNGRVPDEGGLVEAAIAYATGKPLIIYKNDARTAFKGFDNSMITGLVLTSKVSDIKKLPAELEKVSKKLSKINGSSENYENLPPLMKKNINFGRKVWKLLQLSKSKNEKKDILLEKIIEIVKDFEKDLT